MVYRQCVDLQHLRNQLYAGLGEEEEEEEEGRHFGKSLDELFI